MRSAAPHSANPAAPADAPSQPGGPRSAVPWSVAWGMLAFGVAGGLAAGQFAAGRSVRADLYTLKKDVAKVCRSADALTAAGGDSGGVASLLDDLRAQRVAVDEAASTWQDADAALARAAGLRERAEHALTDARRTAEYSEAVAAAVSDALERTRDLAAGAGSALPIVPGAAPRRPLIAPKPARRVAGVPTPQE